MSIRVLSDELSNQIAAGEVIENPSLLIKELVENSLDAKATSITIIIENSGLDLIKIEDDGVGIARDDLPLAPLRHSTSKISTFDDLYSISTMGFRGEALASIFSVARVELLSKPTFQEYGYKISNYENHNNNNNNTSKVQNASEYSTQKVACNNGTTIIVKDLFYNTPARKKYLSSPQNELKKIIEVVKTIGLIHPSLQINLSHNSKAIFSKPFFSSLDKNTSYILSSLITPNSLLEISNSTPQMIVSGYIANPNTITFPTKKYCYIFINSRPINSTLLHKAIMNGIGTNIHSGRFPMYLINIIIDPQLIDVNIHPSKREVKFEQESLMFSAISDIIKSLFLQFSTLPSVEDIASKKQTQQPKLFTNGHDETSSFENKKTTQYNHPQFSKYFARDRQQEFTHSSLQEGAVSYSVPSDDAHESEIQEEMFSIDTTTSYESTHKDDTSIETSSPSPLLEYFREYRVIGQLLKTYIIVETQQGMLVIDQHVVEEKFYYELFTKQFNSSQKSTQQLLKPEILTISHEESIAFEQSNKLLHQLGFDVELLQDTQLIIRQVPLDLRGNELSTQIVKDLLLDFNEFSNNSSESLQEYLIEHLSMLSCKASIRAGEEKTHSQMVEIIEKLKSLNEPFNCPHGRPIIVEFSAQYLEKLFGRK